MFTKVNFFTIEQVLSLVVKAVDDGNLPYEIQSDCNSCINITCEFMHDKLKRPAPNNKQL